MCDIGGCPSLPSAAGPPVAPLGRASAARCSGQDVTPAWYGRTVAEPKIWTAEELERMTPAERHAIFEASIVWDIDDAPPELIERARVKIAEHIARTEHSGQ